MNWKDEAQLILDAFVRLEQENIRLKDGLREIKHKAPLYGEDVSYLIAKQALGEHDE